MFFELFQLETAERELATRILVALVIVMTRKSDGGHHTVAFLHSPLEGPGGLRVSRLSGEGESARPPTTQGALAQIYTPLFILP